MMQQQQMNLGAKAIWNTFHAIPKVKPGAEHITALVKERGRVVGYQLSGGDVISKEQGVSRAKQGLIAGVGVGIRKGEEYLKALPDNREGNNLSSLPSIPVPR